MFKKSLKEIIKFLITGFIALFIDVFIYLIFINIIGIFYAKALAFISATIFTFILNKLWTFRQKKLSILEIVKFIFLYLISAWSNATINYFVFQFLNNKTIAFIIANGFCMILNFAGLKFFVFNNKIENAVKNVINRKNH